MYYSKKDMDQDIGVLAVALSGLNIKSIYGVPQGGVVPALALATLLGVPLIGDEKEISPWTIIVDDIIDSGVTRERYPNNVFVSLVEKVGGKVVGVSRGTELTKAARTSPLGEWVHFWWEKEASKDLEDIPLRMLEAIGEDPKREGLVETPARVVKSWKELFAGYSQNPKTIIKSFEEDSSDEIVLLANIEFYSMCEHHMLPFFGKAHVAYLPQGKVVGISKLARLLDVFARRLQIQERLCQDVTKTLMEELSPMGAACVIEATHFCMVARGVGKQNSVMVTSSLEGVFKDSAKSRQELFDLIRLNK